MPNGSGKVSTEAGRFNPKGMLTEIYGWFTEGFDTVDLRTRRHCSTSCVIEREGDMHCIHCEQKSRGIEILQPVRPAA